MKASARQSDEYIRDPLKWMDSISIDRGTWTYYDTLRTPNPQLDQVYSGAFQTPMNRRDEITGEFKTRLDTNMIVGGHFGATRALVLRSIRLYFPLGLSEPDIDLILSRAVFRFCICEKIFAEGQLESNEITAVTPTSKLPNLKRQLALRESSGLNRVGRAIQEEIDPGFVVVIPERAPRAVLYDLDLPKYIAPLMTFSLELWFKNPPKLESIKPSGRFMIPMLLGWTDRAVQ